MVKLNKIYTRTGDDGETGLADGSRVRKDSLRVMAYGAVDETNSAIGLVRQHTKGDVDKTLARIQNDLFDLGADLSTPQKENEANALRIVPAQVDWLEAEIDQVNANLAPLNSFVLPGGSAAACHLHLARTIARRAESQTVALMNKETINPEALKYLNRLSDYLFVLARAMNSNGKDDILWVPGASRND